MAKTLNVHVTQDDIKRGKSENPHLCPIACALRKQGHERITVENWGIQVGRSKDYYDIPAKATAFIEAFDFGVPVKPFSFVAREV